jgi:hypothetical protein
MDTTPDYDPIDPDLTYADIMLVESAIVQALVPRWTPHRIEQSYS